MLLRCPSCGGKIRATDTTTKERFRFLCQECEHIVDLNPGADEIPTTSSAPIANSAGRVRRVLVVDDTASFAQLVKEMLEDEGYEVMIARDGFEALKKILEVRPDAIFLDLFMPRMTGFEVLRTLRTSPGYRNFRDIPVLVSSGIYHPAEFEILNELGANGYIGKENVQEELVFRIRKMVGPIEGA